MSVVVAVLVVPAEGDPGGLLAAGHCGARPPRCALRLVYGARNPCPKCAGPVRYSPPPTAQTDGLYVCDACDMSIDDTLAVPSEWRPSDAYDARTPALPLWWDGALVTEGWDRARRVARKVWRLHSAQHDPRLSHVLALGNWLAVPRLSTGPPVAARVDGRLVEVP